MGSGGSQEVSFDGTIARRLVHDKKLLVEGVAEKGGISVAMTSALALLDWNFIWAEPLKFENAATSVQYIGQSSVGGVLCHVIDLQYSVPGTDISSGRWWFAVEDKLPRMFQKFENMVEGKFIRELRITNLQIDNSVPESRFKLELPEGYAYQSFIPTATKVKLIAAGQPSPDWVLQDVLSKEWRLSDFRGKVVVLKFWTSSCGYCKLALPEIQKIYEKYKDKNVQVFGVNVQEDKGVNPAAHLKSKGGDYLTLVNGDKTAFSYGVQGVPVFYIIDREGKVAYSASGYNPNIRSQLEEAIDRVLSVKTALKVP
jgi:thiol-disulfide isomerase/thioredoxin